MKEFWSATLWTHRKLCLILLLKGYFSHVKYFDTKLYRGYELSIRSNANNYAIVIYYRKSTKLLEGNVFSRVCPSVHSLTLTSLYRCNQPPSGHVFTWTSQYRDPTPTPTPLLHSISGDMLKLDIIPRRKCIQFCFIEKIVQCCGLWEKFGKHKWITNTFFHLCNQK